MYIGLDTFVKNFGILFGMFTGILVFWHNMVTIPSDKKADKKDAERKEREQRSNNIQEQLLKSQNDGNILTAKMTEQMLNQGENHQRDMKQVYVDLGRVDDRLTDSYVWLNDRLVKVEDIVYDNGKNRK